ncbi:MAG: alpha/beta hydrolase family protein [Candidatus Cryptobacteroides sp.]
MNKYLTALLLAASFALAGPQARAQKIPLSHDVYDSWQSVKSSMMSEDGQLLVYCVAPQQGDGSVFIENPGTSARLEVARSQRYALPRDGKFVFCTVTAPYSVTRQAKIDKKKADEMPSDTLVVINATTMEEVCRIGGVKSFKSGFCSAPYAFVSQKVKDRKSSNLLIVPTDGSPIDTLRNISDFVISKEGDRLCAVTAKEEKDSLSVSSIVLYDLRSGVSTVLHEGAEEYAGAAFDFSSTRLAFLATEQKEKTDGTPAFSLYLSDPQGCRKLVDAADEALPEGWVLAKTSKLSFSNASSRIVLSLYEKMPPKDTTVVDFEAPRLDIWCYDAQVLPPMSKASNRKAGLSAVVPLAPEGGLKVLSLNRNDRIIFPAGAEAPFALSVNMQPYLQENFFAAEDRSDVSLVDLATGKRSLLFEAFEGNVSLSPHGRYLLGFDSGTGDWLCTDLRSGGSVNLTAKTGVAFYDTEDDHPSPRGPVSRPQWVGEDEAVLLCDEYDLWKFSPDGKTALNLTGGKGRASEVVFRPVDFVQRENPYLYGNIFTYPKKGSIELSAFCRKDSRNGFGTVDVVRPSKFSYELYGKSFASLRRASKGTTLMFTMGDFRNPMDLYASTTGSFKDARKLTAVNPQQQDYIWGDVRMVHWEAYDGTPLKGLLFTPENLDSTASYPMLVYFYEKNAESLYNYRSPSPSRSVINIPYFVSNGYVVFVPDVVYTPGHPGESAYNCICSGAEAMCSQFPFINRDKMAIQGQSWGGYQTAYLVTRTDMFAAAGAGAPVANMTSAYGGIRWESGHSRITQYEYGQSRIGKSLWDEGGLDLYIENSPVFFAPNVKTPVLIMHNDKDGAVPWYQGIEFFMSLRRLGKPAWLLEYNDEAHNLSERRNAKDLSIRLQQFFDHYLKDAAEPAWMKYGIPSERKGDYFGYEYAE